MVNRVFPQCGVRIHQPTGIGLFKITSRKREFLVIELRIKNRKFLYAKDISYQKISEPQVNNFNIFLINGQLGLMLEYYSRFSDD